MEMLKIRDQRTDILDHILTGIARLVHVFDLDLMTQILSVTWKDQILGRKVEVKIILWIAFGALSSISHFFSPYFKMDPQYMNEPEVLQNSEATSDTVAD